jgi:uncharacterized membrane protein HdeD (DUF308 family)
MSGAATPISDYAHKTIGWSIFLSILLIIAGFCTLVIPALGGLWVTIFVGWAMIVSGITHFVIAWKTHTAGSKIWEILVGLVYLAAGLYLIMHPAYGLASLTLLLAYYLFFEAIFEIIHFFQVRPRHGAIWILFDGLITLLLGVMIWKSWPSSSIWAIGTLVGISMLFSGFSRLMLSLTARRALKAFSGHS